MLALLRELVTHKGHANASLLSVVQQNEVAASDQDIIDLLQHILVANRFWISAVRRVPFEPDPGGVARRASDSLVQAYRTTQREEAAWLNAATEADCAAMLHHPLIPGGQCSVSQAFLQVCMHSHGPRAQIATRLRRHGVEPPQTDFILWLTTQPEPAWRVEGE